MEFRPPCRLARQEAKARGNFYMDEQDGQDSGNSSVVFRASLWVYPTGGKSRGED
jgi:hypothetical protein